MLPLHLERWKHDGTASRERRRVRKGVEGSGQLQKGSKTRGTYTLSFGGNYKHHKAYVAVGDSFVRKQCDDHVFLRVCETRSFGSRSLASRTVPWTFQPRYKYDEMRKL